MVKDRKEADVQLIQHNEPPGCVLLSQPSKAGTETNLEPPCSQRSRREVVTVTCVTDFSSPPCASEKTPSCSL